MSGSRPSHRAAVSVANVRHGSRHRITPRGELDLATSGIIERAPSVVTGPREMLASIDARRPAADPAGRPGGAQP